MLAFPYDSLMTIGEDQTVTLDRAIDSKLYRHLLSKYFTTGVFPNPSTGFQVLANGKNIIVKAGCANINGVYAELENDQTINITEYIQSNTTVTLAVIVRHDDSHNVRATSVKILSSIGNNLPVFIRNETIYDLVVAKVTLEPNIITVYQSNITDLRLNSEYCGIVSNTIKSIDTTTFYNQIKSDLLEFKNTEQEEFLKWFDTIKNIMNENVAGNLQKQIDNIWNKIYPVGSIYISTNNINPKTLFGGTWISWGNGRVPVGVDTSDSSFNTVEKTGGEKQHALTLEELPTFQPKVTNAWTGSTSGGSNSKIAGYPSSGTGQYQLQCDAIGGDQPHNNLQPYITCYMWKRTA
ncbi:MAG: phage baseplate protein [Thomasclavelia sp.]|uniref:phage baseplate protein n=1 Tax=Thomasclavelia sp. TaxID=3025757 RepID=UPI0039A2D08E